MFGKFKQKSIEDHYEKLINKQLSKNTQVGKIKTIGAILDNETLVNVIRANLLTRLPIEKNNIRFLVYKEYVKNQEEKAFTFTEKEIGYQCSLKSDNLKEFVRNDYDLLINYTKSPNLYTNIITLHSQAKLKVGFANVDDRLFDLVVSDTTFNEAILNQELKKYLTILNKI